jgi:hypothetical protein
MSLATEMRADLEALIDRYGVCWDVFPHEEIWNGTRLQTGFDLELYGTHDASMSHPSPGCSHCLQVYDALQAIALTIVPEERRPSRYELSPFDQSIRYSHMRQDRPDVLLTITIAHRGSGMEPVDECEVRCLDEIKAKLKDLGASHRHWATHHHQENQHGYRGRTG